VQALASLQYLDIMSRAWEEFINFNKVEQDVRLVVARSWERCNFYRIDPYAILGTDVLCDSELQTRWACRRSLIRVAVPYMQMLMDMCRENFIIELCDEEGYVLEVLSDTEMLAYMEQQKMGKGANYNEKAAGTNTLGTVLVEKVPIQLLAKEHYRQLFHEWFSSAAPIFSPFGDLIGVLNISGHYTKVHPYTLGMVIAAAKAIENQLNLEKVNNELKEAHDYSKTVMESITEGLITVNQKGIITWINAAGGRIMGLEPATKIGRPLDELGSILMPMQQALYSGSFSDQETVLENNRERYRFAMMTQPIKNCQGEIIGAVSTLREIKAVQRLVTNLVEGQARFTFDDLIGDSEVFQQAVFLARRAATSSLTILLQGESGTGKELFAQAIHNAGQRANGPFIAVNCGAIPRDLIGSELFGYEEGAFTGARRGGCPGKFEQASGGTIFLDEIGDMPLDLQVSLLRVLQEKQLTRLGGQKVIPIDVRVIAATHRDLKNEIMKGQFRADLFYRLNIFTINIPSLRERQKDIQILTTYFVRKIGHKLGKTQIAISPEALDCLGDYSWPGNIRELENALERAISVAPGDQILKEHLPDHLALLKKSRSSEESRPTELYTLVQETERQMIIDTLNSLKRNVVKTAQVLGISRSTLYNKIKQYKIKV